MKKWAVIWALAVVGVALILGVTIQNQVQKTTKMEWVWVAKQDIALSTPIQAGDLKQELHPSAYVPADAVRDPKEVEGRYTRTAILANQIIQQAAVSQAQSMRELIRDSYGLQYVGMAIPLDNSDFPINHIFAGDTINIQGTFNELVEGQQIVVTRYIAENIPVIGTLPDQNKLLVIIPKNDSNEVTRSLATGKMRVVLDPRQFTGVVVNP